MLAIFDCVDDTKIVGKAIVGEIIENLKEIVQNDSGRKVLMYLMSDRNTTYFHPQIIDILKQGKQCTERVSEKLHNFEIISFLRSAKKRSALYFFLTHRKTALI